VHRCVSTGRAKKASQLSVKLYVRTKKSIVSRGIDWLTAKKIERTLKKPGLYGDGSGLYLQVTPTGSRSWIFRYARAGKSRKMGLAPVALVP
jgi:hypothetical protein